MCSLFPPGGRADATHHVEFGSERAIVSTSYDPWATAERVLRILSNEKREDRERGRRTEEKEPRGRPPFDVPSAVKHSERVRTSRLDLLLVVIEPRA
jgi:hypothetical protein